MADIVNKCLKILLILLIFHNRITVSRKVSPDFSRKHKRFYRNEGPELPKESQNLVEDTNIEDSSDFYNKGLESDVYEDEKKYDQLGSLGHSVSGDTHHSDSYHQGTSDSVHKDSKRYISGPEETYRRSRLSDLDQTAQSADDAGVDSIAPMESISSSQNQAEPSPQSQYAAGSGNQNGNGSAIKNQGNFDETQAPVANQNVNVSPVVRSDSNTGTNANVQGSEPGPNGNSNEEDLLAKQKYALRTEYTLQRPGQHTGQSPSPGNPCLAKPCLNAGICRRDPTPRGFECICDGGFQGRDCETQILPCDVAGCSTLGFCVAGKYDGVCMCKTQYTVKFCSMKLPQSVLETVESKIEKEVLVLKTIDKKYQAVAGVVIFVLLCLLVHAYRVAKRRKQLHDEYRNKAREDATPSEPPPGCLKISNMLCQEFFFCCGTPADDPPKVKVIKSTRNLDKVKKEQYRVLPDEYIPSTSRPSSKASRSHLSKPHLENDVPTSKMRLSKTNLGDFASYSRGHLSQSRLPDEVARSKSGVSKTRLDHDVYASKSRKSKTHFDDDVPGSESHLSRNRFVDDISLNARARVKVSKKSRPKSKDTVRSKLQSRTGRNKGKFTKTSKRKDKADIEAHLLSDSSSEYNSSTSETDTIYDSSRKKRYNLSGREKGKKIILSEGLDSESYSLDEETLRQHEITYPSSRNMPLTGSYSLPYIREKVTTDQNYPGRRVQSNISVGRFYPNVFSGARHGNGGRKQRSSYEYASYINTNNNTYDEKTDISNNCFIDYYHTILQNNADQDDGRYCADVDGPDYDEKVQASSHSAYTSFIDNDRGDTDDRTCVDSHLSQCLHNSQEIIHSLAELYSEKTNIGDFSGYSESLTVPGPYMSANYLNPSHYEDFACGQQDLHKTETLPFEETLTGDVQKNIYLTNDDKMLAADLPWSEADSYVRSITQEKKDQNHLESAGDEGEVPIQNPENSLDVNDGDEKDVSHTSETYIRYHEREGHKFHCTSEDSGENNVIPKEDDKVTGVETVCDEHDS